jgi:glycosyltransferase involved in cell wall biosynthesis
MKIIFSNYDDLHNPYYAGGGAVAVHEVARRLAKNHQVTVITGKYPGSQNTGVDGVGYVRVGLSWAGPKLGQLIYQVCLLPRLWAGNYDVWIESFTPPFSAGFLPLFTPKPVIGLVHMLSAGDMTRKYRLPIFRIFENLGLKLYQYFITPSAVVGRQIHLINPKADISVIPNGIDLPKKLSAGFGKKYLLYLGRIEINQKGLDLLLIAYSRIQNRIRYPLYIAGSGEKSEMKKLDSRIKELNLVRKVRLLGRVTGAAKEKLLSHALIMVVPSRFETFSLASLEALSYSLGLVSFDLPGLSWIPDSCVRKIPRFDISLMSEEILRLSEDKSALLAMGAAGRKIAGQFSWNKTYQGYRQLLTKIIHHQVYA